MTKKRMNVTMDNELYEYLRRLAFEQRSSMSYIINMLVRESYINKTDVVKNSN